MGMMRSLHGVIQLVVIMAGQAKKNLRQIVSVSLITKHSVTSNRTRNSMLKDIRLQFIVRFFLKRGPGPRLQRFVRATNSLDR